MNTFLIVVAPLLIIGVSIVLLFLWGAKGKDPYR